MMTRTTHILIAATALATGCKDGGVDNPTWVDDVRPILAANCVRCHGLPASGGAPDSFRLDKYDDTVLPDGTVIRGAFTMGRFIAHRGGTLGEMPPDYPRGDGQRDTLENWFDTDETLPDADNFPRGNQAGNREPQIEITSVLPQQADRDVVVLDYSITDADADLVDGALVVRRSGGDEVLVDAGFRSGRGSVAWNPATFAEGDYDLIARLTDDTANTDTLLAQVTVAHAGNTLPAVSFVAPRRDTLIGPPQSPFDIVIDVVDPDPPNVLTATFEAVRGNDVVAIATDVPVVLGQATASWDTSALDDAPNWRVRAIVTDGLEDTVVESGRVVVSNAVSTTTFDQVRTDIFGRNCGPCHPGIFINGLTYNFLAHDTNEFETGVADSAGLIYRRVILERTMPPPSATSITTQPPMTDADRATMAEYLLGGALPPPPE